LVSDAGGFVVHVLKYGSAGIADGEVQAAGRAYTTPSVSCGAPIRVTGMPGAEVEIVDAAGRVVARPRDGVWNHEGAAPGVYFYRVTWRDKLATGKLTVVK
jgi:hypothetical protein